MESFVTYIQGGVELIPRMDVTTGLLDQVVDMDTDADIPRAGSSRAGE